MPIAPWQSTVVQWGREATKGTAVAATSRIALDDFQIRPIDAVHHPSLLRGLAIRSPGGEFVTYRGAEWTARGPVQYEQLQNWLSMVVTNAGDTPVGTGPYVYTYTRNPAADPACKAVTLEMRITDGATPDDKEFPYSMASSLAISASVDEPVRYEVNGFSRRIQTSTLTPALVLPALASPPHALSKVYIDSTWATLGSTQVTGQVLDWSVTFTNGARGVRTADGRTDMDFGIDFINTDEVTIDAQITLYVKMDSGQYATERTAAQAGTLRAIRIQTDDGAAKQLQIDFLAKHVMGDLYGVTERDGAVMFTMNLQESTDGTNFLRYKLTNSVATIV